MTPHPSPGRRSARALLVVAVLGLVLLVVGPAGPAAPQDPPPAAVALRTLALDTWVGEGETWVLDLAVEGGPDDATIEGAVHERLDGRDDLDPTLFGVLDGDRVATIPPIALDPTLPAPGGGTAARLSLTLGVDAPAAPGHRYLPSDLAPGVYPVEVEVTGADGEAVARTVVYLIRADGDPDRQRLLVAPVLTVGGPPSVDAEGVATLDPTTVADVIDTADGLTVTDDLPATLVPRPESVEALARDPEGATALAALVEAADERQVVDGPYVDIPLDAWVARGMQAELTRERERGNSILTEHLRPVDSSTWLARDGLTPEAAAELWSVGVRTVVLGPATTSRDEDEDDLPGPVTVSAAEGRSLEVLPADVGLAAALDLSLLDGGPRDPLLDDNGLAAQLAVLAQDVDAPAGVVLLPPEDWPTDAASVGRLGNMLQDPLSPVRPVTVAELVEAVPSRGPAALTPRPTPDLGDYPQRVELARSRLGSFTSLVGAEDAEVGALGQRLLLSGSQSLSAAQRQAYVDSVLGTLDERLGGIQAPTEQTITLTARDADIPLTLRNGLDVPVTVLIELEADSRVEFRGEGDRLLRRIDPGDQEIRIPIHTRVPGDAPIDITVRTPDGVVDLDRVQYTVRSTAISGIGIVLSVGAAAVLLLWWGRHWRRTRRQRQADHDVTDPPVGATT